MNINYTYNKSYFSDNAFKKDIIIEIADYIISNNSIENLTIEELTLVVDEALTNAMEHGNKWDPVKQIHITINVEKDFLNLTIQDEGSGFNIKEISKTENSLHSRGRGIQIIAFYCLYRYNDIGNQLELKFKIN